MPDFLGGMAPPRKPIRKFNRWFGLALAFVFSPLLTLAVAQGYVDGTMRSGLYNSDPKDIRPGVVLSNQYNSSKSGSTCDVVLMSDGGRLSATLAETYCFREIYVGDHVTFRIWRGEVTDVWDGTHHFWTKRNPDQEVIEWFPLMVFFVLFTVALMAWSIWWFLRNRPPPKQLDLRS